jgi:hypothetical protein
MGPRTGLDAGENRKILHVYWLDSGIRFPAGARDFYLLYSVKSGSGAHPASCSVVTGRSFPGSIAARA